MRWRRIFYFLAVFAVLIFLALSFYYLQERERIPQGFVFANGCLEGDTITVATKVAGRVEKRVKV